jgi:hypothetical protein
MKSHALVIALALFLGFALGPNASAQVAGSLANISLLVQVAPGASTPPFGFIGTPGSGVYLIRAIGPSLAAFGVKNPMSRPVIHIFDSTGSDISASALYGIRFSLPPGEPTWASIFAEVGAFPIDPTSLDAYDFLVPPNPPCTIQVNDLNGNGGAVLIEVYVFPQNAFIPVGPFISVGPILSVLPDPTVTP